ncbi:hypothetical protein [Planctomyces sp. SH-PL62]|uniref:hypothetical protein n=1 Tax=Planctomyces sp. SH-PL62 TaxID=1636152 RepID=UPI00078CD3F8|nr:hypothetical protein [Planctomyces sp. SH-PL62]AMV37929.1 hypothetical protein VT85_10870 [Planctomyces sp. SH-PL62]
MYEATGRLQAAPLGTTRTPIMPKAKTKSAAPPSPSPTIPPQADPAEWMNRKASEQASRAALARHGSGRRRFVDPTTCERDYSEAEMEFMLAMNAYKQRSGRMFPTWSEVLEVLKSLGYEKPAEERLID